jgi:hypothetical protein
MKTKQINLFKRLEEASKLPLGHYEKKKAEEDVIKEYFLCHKKEVEIARFFKKKRGWFDNKVQEAANFCGFLCEEIGSKKIKTLVINSDKVPLFSGGCYNTWTREIYFPDGYLPIYLLIHETSHHIQHIERIEGSIHGEEFVEIEQMLFEIAKKYF